VSYLAFPRITFAGRFQADVSTVNNDEKNFDDAAFVARFQQPNQRSWNPRGTGSWRLRDCRVTGVLSRDGMPTADPVLSALLTQADDRVSAKLVDLDPFQQQVSMVFGLRLALHLGVGAGLGFAGDFGEIAFSDIWQRCPSARGIPAFGAFYQSVIAVDDWGDEPASEILSQLRQATTDDMLSIKFNVDGFDPQSTSPTFTWGRIVGSIGPYLAGEPQHFVAARYLKQGGPFTTGAPCRIDDATSTLSLDLGNSLQTQAPGKALIDAGVLRLVAQPGGGQPDVVLATTSAGEANYEHLYTQRAGIVSVQLTAAQLDVARKSPLALLDATGTVVLVEDGSGRYLRADQFVFRMSPGDTDPVTLHAMSFGQPASNVSVTLSYDPSQLQDGAGTPHSALTFPDTVTTDSDGRAVVELTASAPGNPRGYIDGQVYGVSYGWAGDTSVAHDNVINALVFDAYEASEQPTWIADVQPILQQYANLYPAMRDVVDLSDYADVAQKHWRALDYAMGLTTTDPNYMPVTRDLSPAKSKMIRGWLAQQPNPPVFRIDSVESLRQILQVAVALEHATIPPYLTALFSIKLGENQEVAELISSVVMQEMLHIALVCNLLNAVGGHPDISSPAFVPKYPGHLPGGVRPDLIVSLRKCSIEQVRDVFMAIELPSEPLRIPDGVPAYVDMTGIDVDARGLVTDERRATAVGDDIAAHYMGVEHEPLTIGWFYQQIGKAIVELGDDIYTGAPDLQLTPEIYTGAPGLLYVIHDRTHALLALQEIERQGEGTPGTDPTDGPRHELAHYYRFQEIVEGRRLIEKSPGNWVFEGPEIAFDPAGVLPVADDPDSGSLPPASAVRSAAELCDSAYGALLRALHETFNGQPDRLAPAVGLMFSLEVQARELMTMQIRPPAPATAGPSFQPAGPA
jgi:hypothetical protein